MSKVVLVVISVTGLSMIYLGTAATLCVVRDQSLARSTAVLRILVSWFVPLEAPSPRFFPLSDGERNRLLTLYPRKWTVRSNN
jgi:hypothetical protein